MRRRRLVLSTHHGRTLRVKQHGDLLRRHNVQNLLEINIILMSERVQFSAWFRRQWSDGSDIVLIRRCLLFRGRRLGQKTLPQRQNVLQMGFPELLNGSNLLRSKIQIEK